MSFKKKLLSTAMAVAMASGFAVSQNVSAIQLSEEGIGQVLLAPYYSVEGGYKTKFAIYNTRPDMAVKVKVVVRSYGHSTESRDFLCYMTPADVCRFEIVGQKEEVTAADGSKKLVDVAYLTSTDDSVRNHLGEWAHDPDKELQTPKQAQTPLKIILDDTKMLAVDKNDKNEVGHVEVIGAYAIPASTKITTAEGEVTIVRKMKKSELAKVFDPIGGRPAASVAISNNPNFVRLGGEVVIVKEDTSGVIQDRMSYRIPALDGFVGENGVVARPDGSNIDGRVIADSTFDVNVRDETPIGAGFGVGGSDHTFDIEWALASASLRGIYDNTSVEKTAAMVTFPTKYRHRGNNVCTTGSPSNLIFYTAPFNTDGTVPYSMTVYNNMEGSTQQYFSPSSSVAFFAEVNYILAPWFAEGGFFDIKMSSRPGDVCSYIGVPALGLTHKFDSQASKSMLVPMSHSRGNDENSFTYLP